MFINYQFRTESGYVGCGLVEVPIGTSHDEMMRLAMVDAYKLGHRFIVSVEVSPN